MLWYETCYDAVDRYNENGLYNYRDIVTSTLKSYYLCRQYAYVRTCVYRWASIAAAVWTSGWTAGACSAQSHRFGSSQRGV